MYVCKSYCLRNNREHQAQSKFPYLRTRSTWFQASSLSILLTLYRKIIDEAICQEITSKHDRTVLPLTWYVDIIIVINLGAKMTGTQGTGVILTKDAQRLVRRFILYASASGSKIFLCSNEVQT